MELLEVLMSYDSLLSFITSLLAIIIVHNYYDRFTQSCPITKGPWRLPVLGNTLNALLNYHRRLDYLIDQTKTYGPVFRFDLMFKRGTIVTCPQVVEYITQSNFKVSFINRFHFVANFYSNCHFRIMKKDLSLHQD